MHAWTNTSTLLACAKLALVWRNTCQFSTLVKIAHVLINFSTPFNLAHVQRVETGDISLAHFCVLK